MTCALLAGLALMAMIVATTAIARRRHRPLTKEEWRGGWNE